MQPHHPASSPASSIDELGALLNRIEDFMHQALAQSSQLCLRLAKERDLLGLYAQSKRSMEAANRSRKG